MFYLSVLNAISRFHKLRNQGRGRSYTNQIGGRNYSSKTHSGRCIKLYVKHLGSHGIHFSFWQIHQWCCLWRVCSIWTINASAQYTLLKEYSYTLHINYDVLSWVTQKPHHHWCPPMQGTVTATLFGSDVVFAGVTIKVIHRLNQL